MTSFSWHIPGSDSVPIKWSESKIMNHKLIIKIKIPVSDGCGEDL